MLTSSLPVQGIKMILGNDLSGGKVEPNPCVSDVLNCSDCAPVEAIPGLFPACAVTCAMAKKAQVEQSSNSGRRVNEGLEEIVTLKVPIEADVSDGNDQGQQSEDLEPIEEARMSTRMVVNKQENDSEVQKLKEQAISED